MVSEQLVPQTYREQTARSMVDIQTLRDDIPNSMCNNT